MNRWNTATPPIASDGNPDANYCVEVTYSNGLLGWEPVRDLLNWKHLDDSAVVAWRKIEPAFVER